LVYSKFTRTFQGDLLTMQTINGNFEASTNDLCSRKLKDKYLLLFTYLDLMKDT